MRSSGIHVAVVGDLEINRKDTGGFFDHVSVDLAAADMRFGGLEAPLSTRGVALTGKIVMRHPPEMIEPYVDAKFDVLAFATNHCLDYGMEPFVDTLDLLEARGIRYAGAGRTIADARRAVVLAKNGTRVAFLSYLMELPLGWGAHPSKPGVAPIRQDALYGPPYVNHEDLDAMVRDIGAAREEADFVVSSYHWGASQSRTLTLSQVAVAKAAVDAGAGLIIGRHPHIIQKIDVYRGAPIFYAIGNFALDHSHPMFLSTAQESLFVDVHIDGERLEQVSFRPAKLGADGRPRILDLSDTTAVRIIEELEQTSGGMQAPFSRTGDRYSVNISR